MTLRWQVEKDEWCRRVLAKHWPNVARYEDVRDAGKHNLEWVDLIHGGVPCQPSSVAGKRQGKADDRWLWPEFLRVVGEIGPVWVLAENPPGILSIDAGRGFGGILTGLAKLGYYAEWNVLRAADFGAPHIRARLFLVACRSDRVPTTGPTPRIFPDARHGAERLAAQSWWAKTPELGQSSSDMGATAAICRPDKQYRVDHGTPHRLDRLRGLGNAEVPQVLEYIGKRIVDAAR